MTFAQPLDYEAGELFGFGIVDATILPEGRETHPETICADSCAEIRNKIEYKTAPILQRTTIFVGPCVCSIFKKLFDQVAVCSLQFYSIESCLDGIQSGLTKGTDDDRNFSSFQGPGNFSRDRLEIFGEGRNIPNNRGGCNGHRSIRSQRGMRVSSVVSYLHDDPSSASMDGICDRSPASYLFCRANSRGMGVARGIIPDCRSFRDDATRRSALGVILGVQRGRHIVGSGTHPRERRHNDSIPKLDGSELYRTEEGFF